MILVYNNVIVMQEKQDLSHEMFMVVRNKFATSTSTSI